MHRAAHHAKECWGALRTKGMAACSRKHWNTGIAKLSGLATCPRSAANDARDAQHSPALRHHLRLRFQATTIAPASCPCFSLRLQTTVLPLLLCSAHARPSGMSSSVCPLAYFLPPLQPFDGGGWLHDSCQAPGGHTVMQHGVGIGARKWLSGTATCTTLL